VLFKRHALTCPVVCEGGGGGGGEEEEEEECAFHATCVDVSCGLDLHHVKEEEEE
jgi:hypothetical protein